MKESGYRVIAKMTGTVLDAPCWLSGNYSFQSHTKKHMNMEIPAHASHMFLHFSLDSCTSVLEVTCCSQTQRIKRKEILQSASQHSTQNATNPNLNPNPNPSIWVKWVTCLWHKYYTRQFSHPHLSNSTMLAHYLGAIMMLWRLHFQFWLSTSSLLNLQPCSKRGGQKPQQPSKEAALKFSENWRY